MKRFLYAIGILTLLVWYFPPKIVRAAAAYRVMTFNYKYIRPHNIELLKSCVQSKQLDFFGFQEMNFMDGSSLQSMTDSLAQVGYKSDGVSTTYTRGRKEHLVIFYKNTFQLVSGPEETVLGGGVLNNDDTRKILSVLLHDPVNQLDIRVFNQHPVSGEGEPSCTQNKVAFTYVTQFAAPYSIYFGDFNLKLNATQPANQTSCNTIANQTFSISCRPGLSSLHTMAECGGKFPDNERNLDYVMTPLASRMRVTDSYYDSCGFSIGDSGSNDSDHVPLIALVEELAQNQTPSPTQSPGQLVTPTIPPTATPNLTPSPTFGPRFAECNSCGYCINRPPPDNIKTCLACLYPGLSLEDTVRIDPIKGVAPAPQRGKYFSQLGCIDVGASSFSDPQAAGGLLNFLLNKLLFPIIGVLALLSLVYGSFLLVTAQDNPEQIQRGKAWILGAIVGVVFAFGSILLVKTIGGDLLKVPGVQP